jgi:DNA-binding NarL/FixJ family response regulator
MIHVLIADDHALLREGLKRIIDAEPGMKLVAEAADGFQALDLIQKNAIDVAIFDINMPGLNGIDLMKQVKVTHPKLPILILSMYPEDQYAYRAIMSGAAGYLSKESAPELLIGAIKRLASGGKYISPEVAERLVFEVQHEYDKLPHERLSDREYQVFVMIASGKTVSEIAEELHLSVKTISTNRARILEKMQMKHNAELTHYAISNGLTG